MSQNTTNLDRSEIEKFNALAARWWDPEGEFKPLHMINPYRLDFVSEYVQNFSGVKFLDVGCGGGILSEALAQKGSEVTGIDLAESVLDVARLHQLETQTHVNYQAISVETLAEQSPETFDYITCMELLEHVPDPASVVQACAQLLKPGGYVFFSTINRNLKAYLLAVIGAEYILNLLPKGTHDYKKFIRPSELAHWARTAKLDLIDTKGIVYHPLTRQFKLSEHDLDVNYLVCLQKGASQ